MPTPSGEPIAISVALNKMIGRMDKNNKILREVNTDLVDELRNLQKSLTTAFKNSKKEVVANQQERIDEFQKLRRALGSQTRSLSARLREISGIGKKAEETPVQRTEEEKYKDKTIEQRDLTNKLLENIASKIEGLEHSLLANKAFSRLAGGASAAEGAAAGAAAGSVESEVEHLVQKDGSKIAELSAKGGRLKRILGALSIGGKVITHGLLPAAGIAGTLGLIGSTHAMKPGEKLFSMQHPLSSPLTRIGEGALTGAMAGAWLDPFTFGAGSAVGAAIGAGGVALKEFNVSKMLKNKNLTANIKKVMITAVNYIDKFIGKIGPWMAKELKNAPQQAIALIKNIGKGLMDAKSVMKVIHKIDYGIEEGLVYAVSHIGSGIIAGIKNIVSDLGTSKGRHKIAKFLHEMSAAIYSAMPTWSEIGRGLIAGAKSLTIGMIAPQYRKDIYKFLHQSLSWIESKIPSWSSIETVISKDISKLGGAVIQIANKFINFKNSAITWVSSIIPSWKDINSDFSKIYGKGRSLASDIGLKIESMFTNMIDTIEKNLNPLNWFKSSHKDKAKIHKSAFLGYGSDYGYGAPTNLIHNAAYQIYRQPGNTASNNYSPPQMPSNLPKVSSTGKERYSNSQQHVRNYIAAMARKMGIPVNMALGIAGQESSFNPAAGTGTGSYGIYQFLGSTWNEYAKKMGVNPATTRNSLKYQTLAGMLYLKNSINLLNHMGIKNPNGADVYAMELLGHSGGAHFLKDLKSNPNASAASLFPLAAASNSPMFYRNGHALSVAQVYKEFQDRVSKFYMSSSKPSSPKSTPFINQPYGQEYTRRQEKLNKPKANMVDTAYRPGRSPTPDINGVPIHIFDNGLMVVNT